MKSSSKKAPSKKIMVLQKPEPIKKEVNEPKEIKTVAKKEEKPKAANPAQQTVTALKPAVIKPAIELKPKPKPSAQTQVKPAQVPASKPATNVVEKTIKTKPIKGEQLRLIKPK